MDRKVSGIKIIHVQCVIAAVFVTAPLLILGHFNYPSADDWSLGKLTAQAVRNGEGIGGVLKQAVNTVLLWREKGEPRYANAFFGALQPGIFGEHFYRITPWIMIGSLCIFELLFCACLLNTKKNGTGKYVLPIIMPSLLIQLMCVPYPVETFYWWTGSVNYTFIFALSLLLTVLFMLLMRGRKTKFRTFFLTCISVIVAVIVGGDSYAASLSSVCLFAALSPWLLFCDRCAFFRTLPITVITGLGLIVCLIAPGNQVRLNNEFGGTTIGAFDAVVMSMGRTCMNIYSWTNMKIIFMVILTIPFLWKALKMTDYSFRHPVFFTVFTFGIYASQITATMYVDGSTGGRRMADILYYGYHVWMLLNEGYWIGWIQRREMAEKFSVLKKMKEWTDRKLLVWFSVGSIILAGAVGIMECKTLSTYRACVWLVKGYARDYAQAWEERLVILKDDSVKEVYFDPLPGYEELVFYTDLQYGDNWVNKACADYYDKDYVGLK